MNFAARPALWTGLCLAFVTGNFFFFREFVAPALAGQDEVVLLLAEKGLFAALLAAAFTLLHGWRIAGFRRPQGWFWPLMGGAIWIGIVAAVPGGALFLVREPALALGYGVLALLVAFGEEGVFRGVMLNALSRGSVWGAALLTSVLFGAVHLLALTQLPASSFFFAQAVGASAIGLLFAGLTLRYQSIYPAIFFHFLLDAVQFWNAGGIEEIIRNTQEDLTPLQLIVGTVVATVVFGGWGVFLTALEARKRQRSLNQPV